MADSKISQLTSAGTLDGTESVPIVQSSTTKKATAQAIADLAGTTFIKTLLDDADEEAAMKTLLQDGRYGFVRFYDFSTANTDGFYSASLSGTGTGVAQAAGTATEIGVVDFNLGTVATNRAGWITSTAAFYIGAGVCKHRSKFRLNNLSNATDAYTMYAGFMNSNSGTQTYGAFFRYTHSVNGGNWQAVLLKAGVETAIDTGIAADATSFHTFAVELSADALTATFKIDDAQVAQSTSNAPGATNMGSHILSFRSAGTASLSCFRADYIKTFCKLTTPRT